MQLISVHSKEFEKYGKVLTGYDVSALLDAMNKIDLPAEGVAYEPGIDSLEACTDLYKDFTDRAYGGMPIQIGYCNGTNTKLNCLEYHRDSEIDIAASDCVLLLARQQDAADGKILDSSLVEAFFCPAGIAVELYATTLHYAPCSAKLGASFRVVIILPKGTNYDAPKIEIKNEDDRRLFASNKWLIAHADAPEAKNGAVIGISGENIDIAGLI